MAAQASPTQTIATTATNAESADRLANLEARIELLEKQLKDLAEAAVCRKRVAF